MASKFIIFSEFGELLDLAMRLKFVEGHEVLMHIPSHDNEKIGDGIIDKEVEWWTKIGKGYVWVFDGCAYGGLQDWLRDQGEAVFGGTKKSDFLENDRQAGQALFKAAGFIQPFSKNFKTIEETRGFVESHKDKRWILKQNGSAPKSLNYMGKFSKSEDMLHHLDELSKSWNEAAFGKFDCDLMEVVEGVEMAASAFFNGKDFLRDAKGKVVGFLNFEEKKEVDGGLGETTGEMGTTFIGVDETNPTFKEIMLKPKVIQVLRDLDYRGVFDINCIKTDKGMVALEPTCRFGVPATSYEFMEGLNTPTGVLLTAVAKGDDIPISIQMGIGMVMVIAAKPFPLESDVHGTATSEGEKLWILNDEKPVDEFSAEQRKHIHLENFCAVKDKDTGKKSYRVATSSGYLLTITGKGKTIPSVRESLISYIKDNLYLAGMKYRSDIGARIEDAAGTQYKKQEEEREVKELDQIKTSLRKALYGE